jgi:Isochorismatase family
VLLGPFFARGVFRREEKPAPITKDVMSAAPGNSIQSQNVGHAPLLPTIPVDYYGAQQWRRPVANFDVTPNRTALINVDMQNCFVEGSPIAAPDGLAVLERINRVAAACRKAGILVVHTSVAFRADGSNLQAGGPAFDRF